MRKTLLKTGALALGMAVGIAANAQLANGSTAPNFTINDINGNTWDLYTVLGQGKTVIMDVSATWCGPCWNFHQAHVLKTVWENHGPAGANGVLSTTTDDMVVFYVEGDHTTTLADLQGTGTNTQGDWVTGTPYPIIDDDATVNINNNYNIGYFPTIYMICPDKVIREIGQAPQGSSSYYTDAQIYAIKQQNCFTATANADASLHNTDVAQALGSCDSVTPTIVLGNYSTNALTSATITYKVDGAVQRVFNWTGNLPTYATTPVTGIKVGAPTTGTHALEITVSAPNGGTDAVASNDVSTLSFNIYSTTGGPLVSEPFANFPPSGWMIENGGASDTWAAATVGNPAPCTRINFYDIPAAEIDAMILPAMNLSAVVGSHLKFDRAKKMYSATYADQMDIKVSTDCGNNWTTVWSKKDGQGLNTVSAASTAAYTAPVAADWKTDSVSLASYIGQTNVMIKFVAISGYGNNLFLDNVNVTNTVGITANSNIAMFEAYPNPAKGNINLNVSLVKSESVNVMLVNNLGQVVYAQAYNNLSSGDHKINVSLEGMASGMYTVVLSSAKGNMYKKVMISE